MMRPDNHADTVSDGVATPQDDQVCSVRRENDTSRTLPESGVSALEILAGGCLTHPMAPRRRNSGVYFLVDHDEIIYVGSSTDIETRLEQHFSGVAGRSDPKVFDRVLWVPLAATDHADHEGVFIRALAPRDNLTAPASRGNDAKILHRFGLPPPPANPHAEWIRRLRAKTGRDRPRPTPSPPVPNGTGSPPELRPVSAPGPGGELIGGHRG